jgi:tripartite-type tricarboxylate transporter receptor subunit TctC
VVTVLRSTVQHAKRGRVFLASVVLLILAAVHVPGLSSVRAADVDFPNRPVTLVNPGNAGSGTDIIARIFAGVAQRYLGQPIEVLDIVGGANGSLGAAKVAAGPSDGYMLLIGASDSVTIEPHRSQLPYSYKSFTPVAQIDSYHIILVAGPRSPVKSFASLKAYAKQHPNELTVGVPVGGSPHLATARMLQALGGIQVRYIPFQSATAVPALLAGTVDLMPQSISTVLSFVQAGTMYPLFVTSVDAARQLPNVPGAKALGVPGAAYTGWRIIFAPVRTPADVVGKLNTALAKTVSDPEYKAKLLAAGGDGGTNTSIADIEKMLAAENASVAVLLRNILGQR